MRFPLREFRDLCSKLYIPSRDEGLVPFKRFYGSQEHALRELARALEDGVHDVTFLKGGRQLGGTTLFDALDLFWLQTYEAMIGMKISDDDPNLKYRRDVVRQMLLSLPRDYRYNTRADNEDLLLWASPSHSRLIFTAAGKRMGANLGRSKGLNYIDGDEVGLWPDQKAVSALRAAFSKKHPKRLAVWNGTAKGDNTFKTMCETAGMKKKAVAQRFVFLAWWQHSGYAVRRGSKLFERYGRDEITDDEREWMREVKQRYGVEITMEQIAWYRWQLEEEFFGDEDMLAQEFGVLPERCFVAFGDKFFNPVQIRKMTRQMERERTKPLGFTMQWGDYFDLTEMKEADPDDATLRIWEQPDPGGVLEEGPDGKTTATPAGVYLVGAKSAFSDNPDQPEDCAIVWRIYPDKMVQVAEYCTEDSDILQFAWMLLYLCASYKVTHLPTYLGFEVQGTGLGVLAEIKRMIDSGHGFSPSIRSQRHKLFDFGSTIQYYLWMKPDLLGGGAALEWQSSVARRPMLLHALRGQFSRNQLVIRSPELLHQLGSVRRGEDGDNDMIAAGGKARDGRVIAAGIATWFYLETVVNEIARRGVANKDIPRGAPRSVAEYQVQQFIRNKLLKVPSRGMVLR